MAFKFPAVNTASYIDCGSISIPTGDWSIFYAVDVGTLGSAQSQTHVCIGTASDTIEGDNSNITIGTSNTTSASPWELNQLMVTGIDSAGVNFGTRPVATYMGSATTRNVLSGLGMSASGSCLIVVTKVGSVVQLWQVLKNQTAELLHQTFAMSSWGSITTKPLLLGCLNHLAKTGFVQYSSSMQRFGKVARTITPTQMEQLMCGADPVTLLSMSAPAGDLYWAFDDTVALVNGATQADLVQGQLATVNGANWQTPTQIIPLALTTNDIRLLQRDIYHTPVSPGPIRLDGTYRATGTTINVQARLLNSSTQAVIQDWQTIASSVTGGSWTGTMSGVVRQLLDYELNIRLVVDDVAQTAQTGYACQAGVVIEQIGQSLNEYIRYQGAVSSGTLNTNVFSFIGSSVPPSSGGSNYLTAPLRNWRRGKGPMYKFLIGYGEYNLANIISQAASCRVLICNDSQQGSSVNNWLIDQNSLMTRAAETMRRQGSAYTIWEQGQADPGSYTTKMQNIYTAFTNAVGSSASFMFGVSPIALTLADTNNSISLGNTRTTQKTWVTSFTQTLPSIRARLGGRGLGGSFSSSAAAANVYLADNGTNDITLVDNIHETADIAGAGRIVERWAQTILKQMGVATYSGLGPEIISATWDGATTIVVTVAHNGGTGLQTPSVGNITGFETSADGGTNWTQPPTQVITSASTMTLTLSGVPAQQPQIRYQYGGPGPTPTGGQSTATRRTQAMIDNPVFDNRTPALNTTLGYPVGFTVNPIITTGP